MKQKKSLLTPIEINKGLSSGEDLSVMIQEAVKDVKLIVVDNESKVPIAQTRLERIQELLNGVEKARKAFKAPYIQTGKDIEATANSLKAPLTEAKESLNQKLLAFKKQQEAVILIEQETERKKQETEAREKEAEAQLLNRIRTQINARLYGGQFVTGGGIITPCNPAQNIQEVTDLYLYLNQNFPEESFKHLTKEALKAKKEMSDEILNHQKVIVELVRSGKLEAHAAQKRHTAMLDATAENAKMEQRLENDQKKSERDMEKQVKAATKGVRTTISFTVKDLAQVPVEFLQINSVAVNKYIQENKEKIKDGLQKQEETPIVSGLRFNEHSTFVTR